MVKNQPFPYHTGVAMDTLLYASLKSKLEVAQQLRKSADVRINSLISEITATRKAMDDQVRLGLHDAGRASTLATDMNLLQGNLANAQADRVKADRAFDEILDTLPRRVRKKLSRTGGGTAIRPARNPEELAEATADYIKTLQSRTYKWAGVSGAVGIVFTLIAVLRR